jgi:hypothetical protein
MEVRKTRSERIAARILGGVVVIEIYKLEI